MKTPGDAAGGLRQRTLYAFAKLARDVVMVGGVATAIQWGVTAIGGDSPDVIKLGLGVLAGWRVVRPWVLGSLNRLVTRSG